MSAGRTSGMFPRPEFSGFGYRCDLLNYENDPVFSFAAVFRVNFLEAIPSPSSPNSLNGAHSGKIVMSVDCEVAVPLIEAKGKFEFYVANSQDVTQFAEVIPPTKANVELKDKGLTVAADIRLLKKA